MNAAAFVGGVALLAGIVIAPALPGADDGPLLDYRSVGGSSATGPDELPHAEPARRPARPAHRAARRRAVHGRRHRRGSTGGSPRSTSFDGHGLGHREPGARRRRGAGPAPPAPAPCASGSRSPRSTTSGSPPAYEPLATDLEDARVVPESGTLVAPERTITGLDVPGGLARRARRRPRRRSTRTRDARAGRACRRRSTLPGLVPGVGAAHGPAGSSPAPTTPYEQAEALAGLLPRRHLHLRPQRARRGSSSDAIINFLAVTPRVLRAVRRARSPRWPGRSGLPARVAVGFAPGELRRRAEGSSRCGPATRTRGPRCGSPASGGRSSSRRPPGNAPGQADGTVGQPARRRAHGADRPPTTAPTTEHHDRRRPQSNPFPRGESEVQAGSPRRRGQRHARTRTGSILGVRRRARASLVAIGWFVVRIARKVRRRTRRRQSTIPAHSVAARGRTRSNGSPTRGCHRPRRSLRTSRPTATRRAARRPRRPTSLAGSRRPLRAAPAGRCASRPRRTSPGRGRTPTRSATRSPKGASGRERVRRALRL